MQQRNEEEADKRLVDAAKTSQNQKNSRAYATYLSLPKAVRLNLLRTISILDGSPNITDTREEIIRELRHAVARDRIDAFIERLEGWWFGMVIRCLSGEVVTSIPVLTIETRIDELREAFKRESLPVDYKSSTPSMAVVAELDKRPFVKQLRLINTGTARVEYAIRDFYRASEQRSRWVREKLLVGGELDDYEQELIEAWQPRFAAMKDELTPACPSERRANLGQELFKWAEQEANFPFRGVCDRFLTHGSYHILANRLSVGWHPDYEVDTVLDELKNRN